MAKLKAPLMSLGASGQLGKALVYFPWKGLDVVREYIVPTNPKSDAQIIQRDYLKDAVTAIHAAQALTEFTLAKADLTAYKLLGALRATPRTWFNTIVKQWIDQNVLKLKGVVFHYAATTPIDKALGVSIYFTEQGANHITEGKFWYGTSKSALNTSTDADMEADPWKAADLIEGLSNGTKYYWQFRATAHADFVGVRSGIYHGTPVAA